MTDIATRFRKLLLSDANVTALVGSRVHQGTVPEDTPTPFIFFKREGVEYERCIGETAGADPFRQRFAVECVGLDLDDSQEIADEIRDYDGYTGTFGDSTCKGIFVDDQNDGYEPEFGDHVASLSVEVIPT